MKKGTKYLGIVLVAFAAVALVFAPAMAADKAAPAAAPAKAKVEKAKKEMTTVTCTVAEVKSKKGKVIGATLQCEKDTITIVKKGKGVEVAKLIGKKVEVTGSVVAGKKGGKKIYVKEFKALD